MSSRYRLLHSCVRRGAARRRTIPGCRGNQHGFFVVWVLGLSLILLFMGLLATDFWHAFSTKRSLADVADSAAALGARQIDSQSDRSGFVFLRNDGSVERTVCAYLQENSNEVNCDTGKAEVILTGFDTCGSGDNRISGYTSVQVKLRNNVRFIALRLLPESATSTISATEVEATSTSPGLRSASARVTTEDC